MGDDGPARRDDDAHHSRAGKLRLDSKAKLAALEAVCPAIAHPARRQILLSVQLRGTMTAGDIANRFDHAWPTTTRHLGVLVEAGLLRQTRQGRNQIYEVERTRLDPLLEWLGWFEPKSPEVPRSEPDVKPATPEKN